MHGLERSELYEQLRAHKGGKDRILGPELGSQRVCAAEDSNVNRNYKRGTSTFQIGGIAV